MAVQSIITGSILKAFPTTADLPRTDAEQRATLRSKAIREIRCFALGPLGTNMIQAAQRWYERMEVADKALIIPCETPEHSLTSAESATGEAVLALFWTCAVYVHLNEIFFRNIDCLPFQFQQIMPLDEMQLACRPELVPKSAGAIPEHWRISTHASPSPLIAHLSADIVSANSNAAAAKDCACGNSEACITTEAARLEYGLAKLFSFGSPDMVFFGGVTAKGATLLRNVFAELAPRFSRTPFTG